MSSFLRTLEVLSLSLWLGSDVFLSFVVAPGAFHVLASRDQAGAVVGYSLTRMHLGGILCGMVFLMARLLRTRTLASYGTAPALCLLAMILLTTLSQFTVSARMAVLRAQMGSIQATEPGSPLLAQFTKLHGISVALESAVLLVGFVAMYYLVRERSSLN
jgi:uncharacterized membrane protein